MNFRRFAPTDLPALTRLIATIEEVDEPTGRPVAAIQTDLAGAAADLSRTGWLAQVEDGELIGYNYGEVVTGPQEVNFWLRGGVQSVWRGQGAGRGLLQCTWADLERLRAEFGDQPAWVNAWAYEHDEARSRLFEHFGLRPDHTYHEMTMPADQTPPLSPLSVGFTLRAWDDSDYEAAAKLRNEAFARGWGYQPTTPAALRRRFQTGRYQAALSFTAWFEGEMVGLAHACLGETRPSEGEVVWLAVAEKVRGRGLGRTLMLAAMNALRQAGAESIALSTDNFAGQVNLGLFTSLGFTGRQAVVDFRREI